MATSKNFIVKNGLEVGGQEVIDSSGVVTSAALGGQTLGTTDSPTFAGLTVDNGASQTDLQIESDTASNIKMSKAGTDYFRIYVAENISQIRNLTATPMSFRTDDTVRIQIASNGDVSFYEDTGTTAKFFWDASTERLGLSNLKLYSDNVRNEGGILYIGTSGNYPTQFYNNDANTVHISGAGNVGIGTSSPSHKLHVSSAAGNGNDAYIAILTGGTGATSANHDLGIYFGSTNQSIRSNYDGTGAARNNLVFSTSGSEVMYIDSSGNVGIGTSSPSTKLHLGGTAPLDSIIRQDSTVSGTNWEIGERAAGKWQIWEDDTDSVVATFMSTGNVGVGLTNPPSLLHIAHDGHGIGFDYVGATLPGTAGLFTSSSALTQSAYGDLNIKARTDYGGYYGIGFFTAEANNTPINRMVIKANGNVGIGTTNPGVKLDVAGSARFGGNILPSTTDAYDLGSSSYVWRNIYTGDLHLSNEAKTEGNKVDGTKGNWTIQEGEEYLYIINNKNGKKYKFALEEIE